jgi:glycosyltransferase involved in cell wall biosynthesis
MNQPLVSVVTPCLNSGRFLEKTLESILGQDYPKIELIVVDGGSTDETLDILKRHSGRLQYFHAPERGAADAINRGFLRSQGSIFAWLSADDLYYPGAVRTAVARLRDHPEAAAIYGEASWIDERGQRLGRYPTASPYRKEMLRRECSICQPACFLRRDAFEAVGMLDVGLRVAFDYDLWIRLAEKFALAAVPDRLAMSRMHRANLSLGHRRRALEETILLLRRHFGYVPLNWIYCYLSFLRDGRDQFFEPLEPAPLVFLSSFFVGTNYNRRHFGRYWREWVSELAPDRLKQRGTRRPTPLSGIEPYAVAPCDPGSSSRPESRIV